ncbi:hypothetical protein QEN19_000712 [Hanseniaspora menglaensis]
MMITNNYTLIRKFWNTFNTQGLSVTSIFYSTDLKLTSSIQYIAKDRSKDPIYAKYLKDLTSYSKTGEDNYVESETRFAVLDGVGGYIQHGYDSSIISSRLAKYIKDYDSPSSDLKECLNTAYQQVLNDPIVEAGATTVTLSQINKVTGEMDVLNLGDSWLGVLRKGEFVEETLKQEYFFNAPYQLAKIPDNGKESNSISNKPDDADAYKFMLEKGDLVILSTDGMIDNWSRQKIANWWSENLNDTIALDVLNKKFVELVNIDSKDDSFYSEFVKEYNILTNKRYIGGKEDDITVLVVKVE